MSFLKRSWREILHLPPRRPRSFAEKFGKSGPFGTNVPLRERFRTRRTVALAALGLIGGMALCGGVMGLSCLWKIKSVEIPDCQRYDGARLVEQCGLAPGDIMLGFDGADVEARLRASFPLLASVKVSRHLNGKVSLKLKEEKGAYYTLHNGNYYLISDETFRVLAIASEPDEWLRQGIVYLGLPEEARLRRGERMSYIWLPYPSAGAETEVATYEVDKGTPEESFAYVESTVAAIRKSALVQGRTLTGMELGDRYRMYLVLDGYVKVMLGDGVDLDIKLARAADVLAQQKLSGLPALLDVSDPGRATFREAEALALPEWAGR